MSDSRVSRERLGFLDILGNTIDWTIRGFSTPLVGWRRRFIRSSPFHEVGFGSMVFVRFFRFFNRGIIRTTLLATCWWLRHPIWHRSSLFWVEFPMMTIFGEENIPWRAEIGKSPYLWASRFRSSEVRMNSEKCENEESFSPRWDEELCTPWGKVKMWQNVFRPADQRALMRLRRLFSEKVREFLILINMIHR